MKKTLKSTICPYCDKRAELVTGDVIYPRRPDLHSRKFWLCRGCNAYVGTHKDNGHPLGRLANKELRIAKIKAHAAFDPIWKSGYIKRKDAYKWLAQQLGIKPKKCHIGWFDVDMCMKVAEVCGKKHST